MRYCDPLFCETHRMTRDCIATGTAMRKSVRPNRTRMLLKKAVMNKHTSSTEGWEMFHNVWMDLLLRSFAIMHQTSTPDISGFSRDSNCAHVGNGAEDQHQSESWPSMVLAAFSIHWIYGSRASLSSNNNHGKQSTEFLKLSIRHRQERENSLRPNTFPFWFKQWQYTDFFFCYGVLNK